MQSSAIAATPAGQPPAAEHNSAQPSISATTAADDLPDGEALAPTPMPALSSLTDQLLGLDQAPTDSAFLFRTGCSLATQPEVVKSFVEAALFGCVLDDPTIQRHRQRSTATSSPSPPSRQRRHRRRQRPRPRSR
jgi:hypothetical protein